MKSRQRIGCAVQGKPASMNLCENEYPDERLKVRKNGRTISIFLKDLMV